MEVSAAQVFIVMAEVSPKVSAVIRRCIATSGYLVVLNPNKPPAERANATYAARQLIARIEAGGLELPQGGVDVTPGMFLDHAAAS